MTIEEMDRWAEMLGPTREARINVITDLLRHANGDGMSKKDRRICRIALDRLRLKPFAQAS